MKYFLTLILLSLLGPFVVSAQNSRTGVSFFLVPEKNSLPIGFISFDAQTRFLKKENYAIDYGLRFFGAATGTRGGFFAFGYFVDLIANPSEKFQTGVNLAFLAGGGSAAPDGDGGMAQANVFSQYCFKKGLIVKAGLNYTYVSGGIINGFSPVLGLTWKIKTFASPDTINGPGFGWTAVYAEAGRGQFNDERLSFIGAGARLKVGKSLGGDLVIHALSSNHGGYMQILGSGGPDLLFRGFHVTPALVLGIGGGGGVDTQGGGLYGAQIGLAYTGRSFYAGVKLQRVEAWSEQFRYRAVFVSVGKTLGQGEPRITWDYVVKAYTSKDGFGNIGARFTAFEYGRLRLMGSTFWAFTHDRGAYAEGLFEASLTAPGKVPLYLIGSLGAGAGSGINHRSGSVIYAGGLGISSPFNKLPLAFEGAYWAGGNIPRWSLALSYRMGKRQ